MILMPMDKPEMCEWTDGEGLHRCYLLDNENDCKLQENSHFIATWQEQYEHCTMIDLKGMTNGDVIKALFPDMADNLEFYIKEYILSADWWDAPYERSKDEHI